MNSLSGQSLLQHIVDGDGTAVNALLTNGIVNLDERDEVNVSFVLLSVFSSHCNSCIPNLGILSILANPKFQDWQHHNHGFRDLSFKSRFL